MNTSGKINFSTTDQEIIELCIKENNDIYVAEYLGLLIGRGGEVHRMIPIENRKSCVQFFKENIPFLDFKKIYRLSGEYAKAHSNFAQRKWETSFERNCWKILRGEKLDFKVHDEDWTGRV